MWRGKLKACLPSIGCLYVLEATNNPVIVGDMNVSQEELEQIHTREEIMDARVVNGIIDALNDWICHCRVPHAPSQVA